MTGGWPFALKIGGAVAAAALLMFGVAGVISAARGYNREIRDAAYLAGQTEAALRQRDEIEEARRHAEAEITASMIAAAARLEESERRLADARSRYQRLIAEARRHDPDFDAAMRVSMPHGLRLDAIAARDDLRP